jgi:D-alanyl-D-alanine dipeptidase
MTDVDTATEPRPNEEQRRQFWTEHMERSHELLDSMAAYEVRESGEGMDPIREAADADGVEILFSETKIAGRLDRIFYIRKGLMPDLMAIAREMNERGWILKIEESFRTREMQTELGRAPAVFDMIVRSCWWECGGKTPPLDLLGRRATCLIANYPNRGTHMMGAAVDISVFRRDDGSEVWRGKPYLEMSEYTPMECPFIGDQELRNRHEITEVMERYGFIHYPGEFWHYNKGDAAYQLLTKTGLPATYGPIHWDPASGNVTPYEDVAEPLTPPDVMAQNLRAALERLNLNWLGALKSIVR